MNRKQAEQAMQDATPEVLTGFLSHPNSQVRKRAAHKLCKGGASAIEAFLFRLGGPTDLAPKTRKLTPEDYDRLAKYAVQFPNVQAAAEASGIATGRIRSALAKKAREIVSGK